jgi:hypothetical protein
MHRKRYDLGSDLSGVRSLVQDHPGIGVVAGVVVHQLRVIDAMAHPGLAKPGAELLAASRESGSDAHRVLVPHMGAAGRDGGQHHPGNPGKPGAEAGCIGVPSSRDLF